MFGGDASVDDPDGLACGDAAEMFGQVLFELSDADIHVDTVCHAVPRATGAAEAESGCSPSVDLGCAP